jgi:uncharacterized protein YgiB involved in biofilm formation
MNRRIRKSARVTLVLIGVSTLAACGGDDTRRDVYKSRDDCLADWGNKPEDCQAATDPSHRRMGYFYGPSYVYNSMWGSRGWTSSGSSASHAAFHTSTSHGGVSRGGFGSSAHASGG